MGSLLLLARTRLNPFSRGGQANRL
jgi:hypothetical protein